MSLENPAIGIIRQFQSETDAIREAPEPVWARMTIFVLAGLFASLIALMCLTKIDRVVKSTAGKIVTTDPVNVFQALDPSIIKTINVREGDRVQAGQLLATLDPTFAAADVQQLKLQIASLESQISRDEAELAKRSLVYAPTVDRDLLKYQALQQALYDQRVAQYNAQLNSYDAKIKQLQATLGKLQGDQGGYKEREKIARRIEQMRTTLADHGTGSQLNMLISQDARVELSRFLESVQNSLIETEHTLDSTKADRDAFVQQWSTALSQDLVTSRNSLDTAKAQFEKAIRRQDLVRLSASEPSVVLTLAKLSVGSVLKEGEVLFTLMPLNAPLEAEIGISSQDVGFVRSGDKCVLKVDAFNYTEHGTAEGKVRWISEGAFLTDDNGQAAPAYYKARCTVEAMNFARVPPNFRLIPGMTLTGDVNVGTRSVAMYLLSGLLRGFSESMREPR